MEAIHETMYENERNMDEDNVPQEKPETVLCTHWGNSVVKNQQTVAEESKQSCRPIGPCK
eukprot:scaffold398224_cov17-Prasinocladus_malaysianus.AAC.1